MFNIFRRKRKALVIDNKPDIVETETQEEVLNDTLFSMTCPHCGGKMRLNSGKSVYECPYCKTKFYVYTDKELEYLCMNFKIDSHLEEKMTKEEFDKYIIFRLTENLAHQLLERGYVKIEKMEDYLDFENYYDTSLYRWSIKIVKPENWK